MNNRLFSVTAPFNKLNFMFITNMSNSYVNPSGFLLFSAFLWQRVVYTSTDEWRSKKHTPAVHRRFNNDIYIFPSNSPIWRNLWEVTTNA